MPVNYAERFRIERDSRLDPDSPALPADTTQANVIAAVVLRKRVRSALLDIAEEKLPLEPPSTGADREAIPWARDVSSSPDQAADQALRLLLARFGETFTVAQVLDPNVPDETIRGALIDLVPSLALGSVARR